MPAYIRLTGASASWREAEYDLLERCASTGGPCEVYYQGPALKKNLLKIWGQESSNGGRAATIKRRGKMIAEINNYKWVQTRNALAMKEPGGPVTTSLLVALEYLLKRYDDNLRRRGLAPSDLRRRLREHYQAQRRSRTTSGNAGAAQPMLPTADLSEVLEINVSPEERMEFCR